MASTDTPFPRLLPSQGGLRRDYARPQRTQLALDMECVVFG